MAGYSFAHEIRARRRRARDARRVDRQYRIQFIGRGGRLLSERLETAATYAFTGDEGYVRARVLESNGAMAWAQPVTIAPR